MTNVFQYINTHKFMAFIIALLPLAIAEYIASLEIPKVIMQLFQIGAWSATITVGVISLIGFFKKKK